MQGTFVVTLCEEEEGEFECLFSGVRARDLNGRRGDIVLLSSESPLEIDR